MIYIPRKYKNIPYYAIAGSFLLACSAAGAFSVGALEYIKDKERARERAFIYGTLPLEALVHIPIDEVGNEQSKTDSI